MQTKLTPSPEETQAFIAEYEEARRRPFSRLERQKVQAAAVYGACYTSRCEHAIYSREENHDGNFRELLRHMVDQKSITL